MTSRSRFRYSFIPHPYGGCPTGTEPLSEDDFQEIAGRTESIPDLPAPHWAQDLLRIARAVYLADKRSPRMNALDQWTRTIELSIPVLDLTAWKAEACDGLHDLLETLTADDWQVTLRSGAEPHHAQASFFDWRAQEVALLSGGLDSTVYAAVAVGRDAGTLLLLTFHEKKLQRRQNDIFDAIKTISQRDVTHKSISQTPMASRADRQHKKGGLEPSARSRGLLYAATAVYVAAAYDVRRVEVPENGQLALNPPLTASRPAGCSTRSVHPRVLHLMNQLIPSLGGDVTVRNPFLQYTKGEVCQLVHETQLPPSVLQHTVSCSHPPMRRQGGEEHHCGHCYPCLVRRAGLLAALGHDRTRYQTDPWLLAPDDSRPEFRGKTADLRALHQWLRSPLEMADLVADTPLLPDLTPRSVMPVLSRGRQELVEMLECLLPRDSPYRPIPG